MSVTRSKLKGHSEAVNDVAAKCDEFRQLIATASEDGTVRIWDQRTNKTMKCYREFFSSSPQLVKFSLDNNSSSLFVADEKYVYALDVAADGVLVRTPLRSIDRGLTVSGVDISALSVGSGTIAIGDDDGIVSIFDTRTDTIDSSCSNVLIAKLEGLHTNLIGSIALGYCNNSTVYTGGFDSLLVSWNMQSGNSLKSFNFGGFYTGTTNPPFVHSLSVLSLEEEEHEYLLCALGNGRICLMNSDTLIPVASVEASGGMVSSMFSNGNMVCSGGTRSIKIWDIREIEHVIPEPVIKMSASERRRVRRKAGKAKSKPTEYDFFPVGDEIEHNYKINAVAGSFASDATTVYAADTSSNVSIYNIS